MIDVLEEDVAPALDLEVVPRFLASHLVDGLVGEFDDVEFVERDLGVLEVRLDPHFERRPHVDAGVGDARIEEEYLTQGECKPVHLSMELARSEYEAMIAPYIEETLQAIHTALRSADLTASQVEKILLVGGATRTPMIRRRLVEAFGHEPRGEVDADLCVALGAAIEGAAIAGAEVSAVLVDVTPYTFGTSALGEFEGEIYPYSYVPIIPRNTPIPVRKSEVFFTVADDQTQVDVRIYQGENADALQNIKIGEFRVEGLSKAPAGNEE